MSGWFSMLSALQPPSPAPLLLKCLLESLLTSLLPFTQFSARSLRFPLCSHRPRPVVLGRWLHLGLYSSQGHLCSADTMKLLAQRTITVIGTRAFAVSAAVICNSLPAELKLTSSIRTFSRKLKTLHQLDNVAVVHLRTVKIVPLQMYSLLEPLRYVETTVYVKNRCCQVVGFNISRVFLATNIMKAHWDDDVQLEARSVHIHAVNYRASRDDCCHFRNAVTVNNSTTEGLHERTEHLDIFLFTAHHSMVFDCQCSVSWWKGSDRF